MDELLRHRIHALIDGAAPAVTPDEVWDRAAGLGTPLQLPPRDRRRGSLVTAVAALVALVLVAAAVTVWSGLHHPVDVGGGGSRGSWRALPPGPLGPRRDATLVTLGTSVVVVGGQGDGHGGSDLAVAAFDTATGSWRSLPDLPVAVGRRPLAAVLDDVVYVLGVEGTKAFVGYDVSDNQWRVLGADPFRSLDLRVVADGNRLLLWVAHTTDHSFYEPWRDHWTDLFMGMPPDPTLDVSLVTTVGGPLQISRKDEDYVIIRLDGPKPGELLPDAPVPRRAPLVVLDGCRRGRPAPQRERAHARPGGR